MSLKIRLARGGAKKRPYYRIVIANSRSPRDGNFIEKVGAYDPMIDNSLDRVRLCEERITYWLGVGAEPTDRVKNFLYKAGLINIKLPKHNPIKAQPKNRAQERLQAQEAAKQTANPQ